MKPISEVYNVDCLEYMRSLPDKHFDLCIADPPYGLDKKSTHRRGKLKNRIINRDSIHEWDNAPSEEVFSEMMRISKNQIIWGGNYFPLPPTRCFVCWDKVQPWENFSQCEFAWTSFNYPAKMFRFDNRTTQKIHPTQKPTELYAYLLRTFAKEGDKIFDPYLGSGSSRIAAYKMGFDFVGCEIDERFFRLSDERFKEESLGIVGYTEERKPIKQFSLFGE
jgi:site-specific DNA-methyltransferase (adenine-specific)